MRPERYVPRLPLEAVRVPIYGAKYSVRLAQVWFTLFALLTALMVLVASELFFRVALGAIALLFVAFVIVISRLDAALTPREIRVERASGHLRFLSHGGIWSGFLVLAIIGIVPGASALTLRDPAEPLRNVLPLLGISLLAVGWVVQQLWWLATPAGLRLDETGVRGVRGSKRLDLEWDDLADATVEPSPRLAQLVVTSRDGATVSLDPRYFGSDPNIVALVINFFLAHPEHRATLADPRAALALVEAANSAPGLDELDHREAP